MDKLGKPELRKIANRLFVFFASAWLLIESFDFVIGRYGLDPMMLDLLILLTVFGLPATLIFSLFKGRYNRIAILCQLLNALAAFSVLYYFVLHPLVFDPGKLRILALQDGKEKAFESLNAVAVLPFSNNMGDDSQDYLLAGMHDGLISEIGQLGSIYVISKTSSLAYKDSKKSIKSIARELKVDAVVEASITRVDTVIEFRVSLINAFPDELILWNHSYTTSLNGLPNLYKEVTKNVALKINNVLEPKEAQKLVPRRTPNPGAYEATLRGTYYMGFLTREGFELAEAQFRKAIEIDSLFAPGYGGLAGILASSKQMGYVSGNVVNPVLDSLAKKTYELDSLDDFILFGIASHLTWTMYDWKLAEKYFRESININPNKAISRATFAHHLMILGRWDEAWEQMEYAIAIDPQNPWVIAFSAAMYFYDGKLLSGARQAQRLVKIEPNHPMANHMMLAGYIFQKKYDLALIELKKFAGRTGASELNEVIDEAYQDKDFKATLRAVTRYLEEYTNDQFVSPNIMYILFEFLGETEKQLEYLMKMYEQRDPSLPYYAIRTGKPIEEDPTYRLIMKEIGLW